MRGLALGFFVMTGFLLRRCAQASSAHVGDRTRPYLVSERDDALFRAFIKACPDIIWLKDENGVYVGCNDTAAAMLGAQRGSVVGKTDAQLFSTAIARRYREADLQVMAARYCIAEEHSLAVAGTTHIFDTIKCPVVRDDGTIEGVLGVARDVTEQRRQERKIREQEALLQDMSSLARVGGWEIDVDTSTFTWTTEHARLHGMRPDEPLTLDICIGHYIEPDQVRIRAALQRTLQTGDAFDLDVEMRLSGHAPKLIRAHSRATISDGRVTRVWGMMQDVTERRKVDESIRMADLIYRTAAEAIAVTDNANMIVDANPAFQHLVGYNLDEIIGRKPRRFFAHPVDAPLYDAITRTLDERGQWAGEMLIRHRDGRRIAVWVQIDILRESGGAAFRRALHIRDLTEQKDKDEQIWRKTNFDSLSGLPNRSLLLDRLEQEIRNARADGRCIGVLCIDLDRFTAINDMVGHAYGDAVLVQTATRIRALLPDEATLSRLGSDRFAAILPHCGLESGRHAAAILKALAEAFEVGDDVLHISASIGVTVFPEDAKNTHGLLNNAEQAMASAKRAGGNRLHYFAPALQQTAVEKVRLTTELRHALARGQLHVYYQPIVDCATGRIRKAEALLRWVHPVLGQIAPARFIPLAEESGLIVPIGEWVVEEALASIARWRSMLRAEIELSVNASPAQFENEATSPWLERIVGAGLGPGHITVEITENMLVNDSARMQSRLKRLQAGGTKVSLDDFGTGFSSLSYLKLFAVDYLKIDRSFIQNIEHDADDRTLTQAIIEMSHKLRIETIAEGVETAGQRDILQDFGCDYLQGYLYAPALDRDAFEALLRRQAG